MTQWQMINKSEMKTTPPKLQCIWIDKSFLHTFLKIQIYGVLDTNSPHVFQSILFWCVTYASPLIARSITEASSETSDEIFVIMEVNYLVFKWAWDLIYNRSFSKKSSIGLFSLLFFGCLAQCLNFLVIRCVLRSSGDNLGHSVF